MAYSQQPQYTQQGAYGIPPQQPGYAQQPGYSPQQQQQQQQQQQHPGQYTSPAPGQHQYQPPPHPQQHPQMPNSPGVALTPAANVSDHGMFDGGSYSITHRDTNAILTVDLNPGAALKARPGAMIHMAATVKLSGKMKFSMKKLLTGSDMNESSYVGPGRVALGPTLFGDIVTLQIDPNTKWKIGRDSFLAGTPDVKREVKNQGFGKTLFSGEDMFIYHVVGNGLIWLTSFGAVDRLDLRDGEQHIVDNGHLVAWSCNYQIERAGGGTFSSMKTGEGLVCRFTGPGSVYVQTRNMDEFQTWIQGVAASSGGGGGSIF